MRPILVEGDILDEDLLVAVSLAATNEKERLSKFNKDIEINKINVDDDSDSAEEESSSSTSNYSSSGNNNNKSTKNKNKKGKNKNNTVHEDTLKCLQEVGKIAAKINELATSNADLTAQVNTLQNSFSQNRQQMTPDLFELNSSLNPTAAMFRQRQVSWRDANNPSQSGNPSNQNVVNRKKSTVAQTATKTIVDIVTIVLSADQASIR